MSVVFSSVKYIFRNFWYVLLFALLPAIFLALSLDYRSIHDYVVAFFTGDPRVGFLDFFCIWSLFHFHSSLSIIYGVCMFVCVVVSASFLFVLVEKHMRLGRRTPNGLLAGFKNAFLPVLGVAAIYLVIYEVFVVVLSSLLFAVAAIPNTIAVSHGHRLSCAFFRALLCGVGVLLLAALQTDDGIFDLRYLPLFIPPCGGRTHEARARVRAVYVRYGCGRRSFRAVAFLRALHRHVRAVCLCVPRFLYPYGNGLFQSR